MKLFHSLTFRIIVLSIMGVLFTAGALVVSVILSENKTEEIISSNRIQIEEQTKINMKPIVRGVYNAIQVYDKILMAKLNDGLAYLREKYQSNANLNQIVDDVSRLHGVNAIVFRKLDDSSMVRVSTNIIKDGKRVVNTKIYPKLDDGSPNPVISSVINGKQYVGRAKIDEEWVNAIYEPIIEKGQVTGMLFVSSTAADMRNFIEGVRNLSYGERGSVFAIGGKGIQKGVLAISMNKEMDNRNAWDITNSAGEFFWRKIVDAGSSLPENIIEYLDVDYMNKNGQEYKLAVVEMYYAPWDWVIGVSIPREELEKSSLEMENSLFAAVKTLKRQVYMTGAIMIVLILIVSSIFAKNLTKTIDQAIVMFDKIAKGDMENRLETAKDDMGEMARYFNKLMDNLHGFMKKVMSDTLDLNATSEELFNVSGKVEDIADRVVMRSNMIASTTEQMVVVINVIATTIERMSVNMGTIATTMKDMSVAINKITNNVEDIHKITTGAKNKVTAATEVIGNLGTSAREIGEVTEVIKRIAEKTNILALNATIEAAYAGEAGKGFAVVASEIKELANQSADSANYITQRIENIQNGTSNAVNVIHDVSNIIVKISDSVDDITGHNEETDSAKVSSVTQTNTMVRNVADTVNDIAHHSNEISRNIGEVAKGIANVNNNVVNMNQISEEIKQGSMQVHQRSKGLEKISAEFKDMLNIYKV